MRQHWFMWCIELFYRWYITLKMAILEIESSIDIALIDYLNWPQKSQLISHLNADNTGLPSRIHPSLTDELSSPMMQIFPEKKNKITELSGIVIILVDHFNKFSFSFMFHLDESAGRKYFKFRLWSICVSSQYVLIQ